MIGRDFGGEIRAFALRRGGCCGGGRRGEAAEAPSGLGGNDAGIKRQRTEADA